MTYIIDENCIVCGVCEGECPEEAIVLGEARFQIDPDKCSDCGSCTNVCPVGAPQPEENFDSIVKLDTQKRIL